MKTVFVTRGLLAASVCLAAGWAAAADEFAIAFRVRLDEPARLAGMEERDGGHVAYGLRLRTDGLFGSSPFVFSAKGKSGFLGARVYRTLFETETNPGVWHHVAFTFSHGKRIARVFFDGVSQESWKLADEERFDDDALLKLTPPEGFAGEIAGLKVFKDRVPEPSELFAGDVPADQVAAAKAAFEKAAAEADVAPAFADWCRAKARAAASFGKGADLGAWHRLETLRHRLSRLVPLAKTKVDGAILPFTIDRFSPDKHLPYAVPADAKPLKGLSIAGAKGEWDCESFMVHPLTEAKGFLLKPTDLTGPGGAVIRAEEIDVRVVKCWYQCGGAYMTYVPVGRDTRLLCPELLVHDDALVRVDTENRVNRLRFSYADGDQYLDVSELQDEEHITRFNINREPVLDAKTFRPLDLREGEMRQFWLTLKVPDDRAPGDYAGALEMSVGGKACGTIPFTVRIYPFRLPWPATHYDIDRPMIHAYLAHATYHEFLSGEKGVVDSGYPSWAASVRRRDAMIRNMVEHGIGNIEVASFGGATNEWDLSDADAILLKRNGAQLRPILGDIGVDQGFAILPRCPPKGVTDFSIESNWGLFSRTMQSYSNQLQRALGKLKETYGHADVSCHACEEAGSEMVRREMPFYATLHNFGGTMYVSQGEPAATAFMVDWDGGSQPLRRSTARSWHASGALMTTYANPHSGPECPDLWRRRKGLRLWFADFDGQREYILFEGRNVWNDFVMSHYKCFNMVQPTFDGVLDSVQWEASREGIDDMRYATLLKRACRAARATGDSKLVRAGREFEVWLELLEYETGDLEDFRRGMAARIAALLKALAAKGVDVDRLSPPLPARQDLPLPQPYKLTGDGYAKRDMMDLACAAWEAEGTEDALFKAVNGHLVLRDVVSAEKVLARIESDAAATPGAKARARLRRGLLGLTRTKYHWTPAKADLEKAKAAFDSAVLHDLTRIGVQELASAANKLMRALGAANEPAAAIEVGEKLANDPLKKALGGWNSDLPETAAYRFVGNQYFALKNYRRAAEWFEKCGRKDFQGLVRLGDAAKAMKDYPRAMVAYSDATKLLDPGEDKPKVEKINKMIGELSKAMRKHSRQNGGDPAASESDDSAGVISLDE